MRTIVDKKKKNKTAFLLLLCLFFASYFEFFFRDRLYILWGILFIFGMISLQRYHIDLLSKSFRSIFAYIVISFFVCIIQTLTTSSASSLFAFSQVFMLFCLIMLGVATKENLLNRFVTLMTVIAVYSVAIYLICIISPAIKDYLVNVISPRYISLGVENAIQEGGGINFVIYNFQQNSEYALYNRNCGPFWEPGMFAVFLNLALFVNIFLLQGKGIINVILVVALLTTMSTGGYFGGLFILMSYSILRNKKTILSIAYIILLIVFLYFFSSTDFLGDKLMQQMTSYQIGNDDSRYGAMLTHLKIFLDHPLWGYYGIEGYTIDGRMALASGLLIPLSSRGFFAGSLYYILLYRASIKYALYYAQKKQVGVFMFLFILLLSFSQTILLTSCIMVYIFAGLLLNLNKNSYVTV